MHFLFIHHCRYLWVLYLITVFVFIALGYYLHFLLSQLLIVNGFKPFQEWLFLLILACRTLPSTLLFTHLPRLAFYTANIPGTLSFWMIIIPWTGNKLDNTSCSYACVMNYHQMGGDWACLHILHSLNLPSLL